MKRLTSLAPHAARVLLGISFTVFGLNGFLHFLPNPPHPGPAGAFLGGLASGGYFFPLLKGTETLAGLLLLSGRFVPLALTLLAPVLVNIVAFHAALDPANAGVPLALVALELYAAWAWRASFALMLRAKADPQGSSVSLPTRLNSVQSPI